MHDPRRTRWTAPTLLAAAVSLLSWAAVHGADGDDLVPLPIKLPKPQAHGTPKDTLPPGCDDVEPVSKKPRPIPKVLRGTANQALQKKVTTSSRSIISGSLDLITDGNNEGYEENVVAIKPKLQWVQIDLGTAKSLSYIAVWHYHYESVIFHDVVVQVSNDPDFVDGVTTLFNNDKDNSAGLGTGGDREYWETYEGKLIAAKGAKARYVRLYSRGSTFTDALNRYTEVEVYGLPR